jgi:queuine tRNA-ribosyltransferase
MLGGQISSLHNLAFYLRLVSDAREKIEEGDFKRWKDKTIKKVSEKL